MIKPENNVKKIYFVLIALAFLASCDDNSVDPVPQNLITEEQAQLIKEYWPGNTAEFDPAEVGSNLELPFIDDITDDYDVFLIGENHGTEKNQELEMAMLQYFHKNAGIDALLMELPFSFTQYMTNYLETGDIVILDSLMASLDGTISQTEEKYQFWQNLREYYSQLPQDEKFRLIGVDIEHQYTNAVNYLYELLPENPAPQDLKKIADMLKENYRAELTQLVIEVEELQYRIFLAFKNDDDKMQHWLGDKYDEFKHVSTNLGHRITSNQLSSIDFNKFRDSVMAENFAFLDSKYQPEKMFGQWGVSHVFRVPQHGIDWFGSRLEKTRFSGRILSIPIVYHNCDILFNSSYELIGVDSYVNDHGIFDGYNDSGYRIFRLDGELSPFRSNMIWLHSLLANNRTPKTTNTADMYQYLIMISESKSSKLLKF
jgi:sulfur relay (sulfurtransferase) DsrC/TusE family protein